jgi:hypothetical protein
MPLFLAHQKRVEQSVSWVIRQTQSCIQVNTSDGSARDASQTLITLWNP